MSIPTLRHRRDVYRTPCPNSALSDQSIICVQGRKTSRAHIYIIKKLKVDRLFSTPPPWASAAGPDHYFRHLRLGGLPRSPCSSPPPTSLRVSPGDPRLPSLCGQQTPGKASAQDLAVVVGDTVHIGAVAHLDQDLAHVGRRRRRDRRDGDDQGDVETPVHTGSPCWSEPSSFLSAMRTVQHGSQAQVVGCPCAGSSSISRKACSLPALWPLTYMKHKSQTMSGHGQESGLPPLPCPPRIGAS